MADNTKFSSREMEVLALCWQCFESEPKIDYEKLSKLGNYTNGSARTIVGNLKRKLKCITTAENANPSPVKSAGTPKTPRKRAPKDTDTDGSPSKKRRSPSKKDAAKAAKAAQHLDDDDEEYTVIKIKPEEAADVNEGAKAFYKQAERYAYPEEAEDSN